MKQLKKLGPSTKTEGTGILTSALFYVLTGNPAWFALLLAIVAIALTIHALAARLTYHSRSSRRGTLQGAKQAKRLPRLTISAQTPLVHRLPSQGYFL